MRVPASFGVAALPAVKRSVAFLVLAVIVCGAAVAQTLQRRRRALPFPDVGVRADDGARLRFYTDCLERRVVVLNFLFSGGESLCPRTTDALVAAERRLGKTPGRDVFFYSISVDDQPDSPEALRADAARRGAGAGWRFLAARSRDLEAILASFGSRAGVGIDHTNRVFCGDVAADRWVSIPATTDPDEIAAAIERVLLP